MAGDEYSYISDDNKTKNGQIKKMNEEIAVSFYLLLDHSTADGKREDCWGENHWRENEEAVAEKDRVAENEGKESVVPASDEE